MAWGRGQRAEKLPSKAAAMKVRMAHGKCVENLSIH
jgi:hypothetical protein